MSKFALSFVIVSLSVVAVGRGDTDPAHHATYSMAVDNVALIVSLPTRNEPGKAIMVSLELQNNNDHYVSYLPFDPSFPFDLEIRDDTGKLVAGAGGVDPKFHFLAAHAGIKKQFDLGTKVHESGHYLLTIRRGIDEFEDSWVELEIRDASFYIGKADNPNQPLEKK